MANENKELSVTAGVVDTNIEVATAVVTANKKYSTYFETNYNVDGTPKEYILESMFNAPWKHVDEIIGYAKYCYRKHGIIMRIINMYRDFSCTGFDLQYKKEHKKARKIIEDFNKTVNIVQLIRDMVYELSLTGNLVAYYRDGVTVDIYPISQVEIVPLTENGKQVIAYKNDNFPITNFSKEIEDKIKTAYPDEVIRGSDSGNQYSYLDTSKSFFKKINCSRYETFGLSIIVPAFEDLAHKTLLKNAERATANQIIDKILLTQVGNEDHKPTKTLIEQYSKVFDGIKGSARATVPYYVNMRYIEPETKVFGADKFIEIDKDILNTLGVSVSLLRGEGGGSYSDGIVNFAGLCRGIENVREPVVDIINQLYILELKRNGVKAEYAPSIKLKEVVLDKASKTELLLKLFADAGLPYEVLYEGCDMDYDYIKLIKQKEKDDNTKDLFKEPTPITTPSTEELNPEDETEEESGDGAGRPEKPVTEMKNDKNKSNNNQTRTEGKKKTNVK